MRASDVDGDGQESGGLRLRVGDFEGPLDLLLHLCRTSEIDLASLPVRSITDQYLTHLQAMEFQDLEAAGAYLVMAATLIYLKSKLLVPPDESQTTDELDKDAEALKQELQQRLQEYERIKTMGAWLGERQAEQSLLWGRPVSELPLREDIPLEDLGVHLLERALNRLIEEQARRQPREIDDNPPSVLERMTEILSVLRDTWSLFFSSLTGPERRSPDVVVSLLAVLELVRLGRIRIQQTELFGDIVIERTTETTTAVTTDLSAGRSNAE